MLTERLKISRKKAGLTQAELARHLGVAKGTVAMWEMGKRTPRYQTLNHLVELLGTNVDYLLGHTDKEPEIKPDKISNSLKQARQVQAEVIYTCSDYDLVLIKKH